MADLDFIKAPLKAPYNVCMWITDSCNLSCKYCYASPFSGGVMDTGRLYKLLDELITLEIFGVVFAGGEPFLHPDIFDIIKYCVDKNIHVGVLTNGSLLNKKAVKRLETIVENKKFILQVSIDSPAPEVNDMTRGKGEKVLKNLSYLLKTDIQVQIACVLTRHNIKTAHLLIEEFYPKVKRYHFLNVQRTEKALSNPELLLAPDQAKKFWLGLREYSKKFPRDLFLPSLRIMLRAFCEEESEIDQSFHQQATFEVKSCSAGLTNINIDTQFNVLGCDIAKQFTNMGNVRDKRFREVWNSREAYNVRNSSFPACYRNESPNGESLMEFLRPEFLVC